MTRYDSLPVFLAKGRALIAKGPIALIMVDDEVEVTSTIDHHIAAGFRQIVLFADRALDLPDHPARNLHRVDCDFLGSDTVESLVNAVIAAAPGTWLYWGHNAEYLFYPFCEHRTVGEMVHFATEERRDSVLCFVIDLYAGDLEAHPDGVSIQDAHLDRTGYYALARSDRNNSHFDRQLDFFGGFRWRFEEHIAPARRRIDRVALFRARPGLRLRPDWTFNDQEYNTYACPWHNSVTASVCSFRAAKALKRNPGSSFDIQSFRWHGSAPFEWHSSQLLNLGLMEPGQWF